MPKYCRLRRLQCCWFRLFLPHCTYKNFSSYISHFKVTFQGCSASSDLTFREAARESRSSPEQKRTHIAFFFLFSFIRFASYIALQFYLLCKWYCASHSFKANKIPLKPRVLIPLSYCENITLHIVQNTT